MKKFFSALMFLSLVAGTMLFAQEAKQPKIETKEELKVPVSEEMASIQTAFQLAEYGYKNGSASSLLCAAEILAQVPTQDMKTEAKQDASGSKDAQSEQKAFTAEQLLEDGKSLPVRIKQCLPTQRKLKNLLNPQENAVLSAVRNIVLAMLMVIAQLNITMSDSLPENTLKYTFFLLAERI